MQTATDTPATSGRRRGEDHPLAKLTTDQVAQAKRELANAKTITRFATGEMERISRVTGVPVRSLRDIRQGLYWRHVDAAEG